MFRYQNLHAVEYGHLSSMCRHCQFLQLVGVRQYPVLSSIDGRRLRQPAAAGAGPETAAYTGDAGLATCVSEGLRNTAVSAPERVWHGEVSHVERQRRLGGDV